MDSTQTPNLGFSPHVQAQLLQAANQRGQGYARGGRGRGQRAHHGYHQANQPYQFTNVAYQPPSQTWNAMQPTAAFDANSFPPLGAKQAPGIAQSQPSSRTQNINPLPIVNQEQPKSCQNTAREFFDSTRGNHRGRGQRRANVAYQAPRQNYSAPQNTSGDLRRPQPRADNKLYSPSLNPHFGTADQQRANRHRLMEQSDYLNYLSSISLKNLLTKEEQQEKQDFRKELEQIAQSCVNATLLFNNTFDLNRVKLQCYGSLVNSFGVAGCDMDLLLTIDSDESKFAQIDDDLKRSFEKALLDAGYGGRLLTNTRVPILRVCQQPGAELLQNLRQYRQKWDLGDQEVKVDPQAAKLVNTLPPWIDVQLAKPDTDPSLFDSSAHEIPLPSSPVSEAAKLEYTNEVGIQCDVNFTNHVALYNTKMLRTYGHFDVRVRQLGVFVKNWAKARDINTPYRGTLSSYGYVLMVLHYLMNIAQPPVIPNLQVQAYQYDEWQGKTDVQLFDGFDVRFVSDGQRLKEISESMPKNHESLGSLLRGFYAYYSSQHGFSWTQDIISIRTQGGLIPKRIKGWTEAKWSTQKQNVRLRYLFAIEDPFELEHNVARTVGHGGIVAIRDEFRRAWRFIEGIRPDPQLTWVWMNRVSSESCSGEEFIQSVDNRGDLLKKDHEQRKQKLRQMKVDLEARELSMKNQALEAENLAEDINKDVSLAETVPVPVLQTT